MTEREPIRKQENVKYSSRDKLGSQWMIQQIEEIERFERNQPRSYFMRSSADEDEDAHGWHANARMALEDW